MTEQTQTLSLVLRTIRSGLAVTRPELSRHTGLGRTIITQRVDYALKAGLLSEGDPAPSTGGRPSRVLRIASGRGVVLGVVFGASHLHLAVADLDGTPLADRRLPWDVEAGPDASLRALFDAAGQLLTDDLAARLWGVCVGVPGPVDFARGTPVQPPIMAGWHNFPLRERLEAHFAVPAWIDNDANVMAVGAWSQHRATAGDNVLLVKASTGIGLGLISRGRLHRGARGAAGDLGHTIVAAESRHQCRCGKFGCLEALAGGWALARDARAAALAGRSAFLQERLDGLSVTDVMDGCAHGDAVSVELVTRAGELVGAQLALLVSVFNPSTVYLAGTLARSGEAFCKPVTEQVTRGALPLATAEMAITDVDPDHVEGVGAAQLAIEELLHPDMLGKWLHHGSPRKAHAGNQTGAEPLYLA